MNTIVNRTGLVYLYYNHEIFYRMPVISLNLKIEKHS